MAPARSIGFRAVPPARPTARDRALAAAVTGPRGRWVTIARLGRDRRRRLLGRSHIDDVTAAGQSSFLPKDAESTRALEALEPPAARGAWRPTKRCRW